jgi:oxygen-dependent protoporphyrinogen oxidase
VPDRLDVVVVGGGISGLAATHALVARGARVVLLEGSERFGGVIRTDLQGGFVLDAGADAILAAKPEGVALCREVGLGDRLLSTNADARTVYVLRRGELLPMPEGMALGVPTRARPFLQSPLFSWGAKLRMGLDLVLPARGTGADESIASFLRRRLGRESVELLGEPLLAGIHAGDPERLSIRATFPRLQEMEAQHGGLIRGMAAAPRPAPGASAFQSLPEGMEELVRAVVARIPASARATGACVDRVERSDGGFVVTAPGLSLGTRAIVLALPPRQAAPLLQPHAPAAAAELASMPSASTVVVLLGLRRAQVSHPLDGYGLLVPRSEGLRTTACSFLSTKLPGRAPDGHVLLRVFLGSIRDASLVALDDDALVALALREMAPLLGITGTPVLARVYRWSEATPQMELGHLEKMARVEEEVARVPGLVLTGSGLRVTGIPDCVKDGTRAAAAALAAISGESAAR